MPRLDDPEFERDELGLLRDTPLPGGLLLWNTVRDVMLWARTENREGLFAPGTAAQRAAEVRAAGAQLVEIADPLHVLTTLLELPTVVDPNVVRRACERISEWAESRGRIATAVVYCQAAFNVDPTRLYVAADCYRIGRLQRARGRFVESLRWLEWAIGLAKQSRDVDTQGRALSSVGKLYVLRGNYPAARRYHRSHLAFARRNQLTRQEAVALHALFALDVESGRLKRAEVLARAAFRKYRTMDDPAIPALAHDVAVLWMDRGRYAEAIQILEPLHELASPRVPRTLLAGSLVRAAGGAGDRARFERYWEVAAQRLADDTEVQYQAIALLGLAHGATSLGEFGRARPAAERALHRAREAGEHRLVFEAESLLDQIAREKRLSCAQAVAPPAPSESPETFAVDLREHLLAAAGGASPA